MHGLKVLVEDDLPTFQTAVEHRAKHVVSCEYKRIDVLGLHGTFLIVVVLGYLRDTSNSCGGARGAI